MQRCSCAVSFRSIVLCTSASYLAEGASGYDCTDSAACVIRELSFVNESFSPSQTRPLISTQFSSLLSLRIFCSSSPPHLLGGNAPCPRIVSNLPSSSKCHLRLPRSDQSSQLRSMLSLKLSRERSVPLLPRPSKQPWQFVQPYKYRKLHVWHVIGWVLAGH